MIQYPGNRSINIVYLEAPIDKVWWSIATTEGNNSYLTYSATSTSKTKELKVGDILTLCYGDIINHSEIIEYEYKKVVSLKDSYKSIAPDGSTDYFDVQTRFTMEQEDSFVKLTLEVSGYKDDLYGQWFKECLVMGWRRSLMNLKSVLELGMDLRNELFSYPRLGVVNCSIFEELRMKTGLDKGNYLLEVFPNSPASKAGLLKGDVIVAIDNLPVSTYEDFVKVISNFYGKKAQVNITYIRNREKYNSVANFSIEDTFTGLVELEGTTFEEVKQKRELLAKQRSASGSIWKSNKEDI